MISSTPTSTSAVQSQHTSRAPSITGSGSDTSSVVTDIEAKTTISLETQVSAGGANFSSGQRQLIGATKITLKS